MAFVRSYQKAEDAYLDAAFLGSMGLDARVVDTRGDGGRAVGISEPNIQIEVPEAQQQEALDWLAKQEKNEPEIPLPLFEPTWNTENLQVLLNTLLVFELGFQIWAALYSEVLYTQPPKDVEVFLRSLALSDDLWEFAYISQWPLAALLIVSNLLCLFHSRTGRLLFAVAIFWNLLITLGPPPQIFGPWWGFLGSLSFTASNLALALMYWSPLRQRFDQKKPSK